MAISIFCNAAFTLIELCVGIAILGVLIGLSIPAINHLRSSADITVCTNNLRQIGLIVHNVAADSGGRIPALSSESSKSDGDSLAEFIKANGGTVDLLVCPAEKRRHRVPISSYAWLSLFENSPIGNPAINGLSVPASQAPLVLERWSNDAVHHVPKGIASSAGNVLMADGSVKKLPLDGDRFKMKGVPGGIMVSLPGN